MNFFKQVLQISFIVFISLNLLSCEDDKNELEIQNTFSNGAYILNCGKIGSNEASIDFYDFESKKITKNVFETANSLKMGDLGQDMLVYGSKIYISVTNSGIVYVLDKNCKIIKSISGEGSNKLQPREFEAYNGKVYLTSLDGYLMRIDTLTLKIDKSIKVGMNPEGLKVVNNKIYVANSGGLNWQGGYNNTLSIVDLDLTKEKSIEVGMNPVELKLDTYNNLYLVSRGDNFGGIPNLLQQIDTLNDEVFTIDKGNVYSIYPHGDRLYLLHKEWTNNTPVSTIKYYDIINKKVVNKSFITDGTIIPDISSVAFDPVTKNIFVVASDGLNNGDLYIFSSLGKLISKQELGGAYPMGVWFVNK